MTPRIDCRRALPVSLSLSALFCLILTAGCLSRRLQLPPYDEFVGGRPKAVSGSILEIYGRYSATLSGRSGRSHFNLLLDPGKSAYLEIVDPAKQLLYSVSLNREEVSLLWAQDGDYVREKATPQNLNAIAGLPIMADDLLLLVAGFGLNFAEWQRTDDRKNGWHLSRASFSAELTMKDHLSKIVVFSGDSPKVITQYDQYRLVDNKLLPARIRFEVPARKLVLELKVDRYVPRDEAPSPDLFSIDLPENAQHLVLREIYRGKPILFQ